MSGENTRTFLIMSHGSWPGKILNKHGLHIASKGLLKVNSKEFKLQPIYGKYKNVSDTVYKIPNNTRLFLTTDYGNSAMECPKYDKIIKTKISQFGTAIFTSPKLIKSLPQKYDFIEQCRLYTDGDKIVDMEIAFEDNPESWNIWEKKGRGLNPLSNFNLKKGYKLSTIIDDLTSTAVQNQRTQIILHCCNPKLDHVSWVQAEYNLLVTKIEAMMIRGKGQIERIWRGNQFQSKKRNKSTRAQYLTRGASVQSVNMTLPNNSPVWTKPWQGINPNYRFSRKLGKFVKKGHNLTRKRTTARPKRTTALPKRPTTAGKK